MKASRVIIPLISLLFLASCNSSSSSKKASKASAPAEQSNQPVPTFGSLPDYGSYSGTQGIAPAHISGFSITPNAMTYASVNETVTITAKVDNITTIPEEERTITFTLDDSTKAELEVVSNVKVNVKCLQPGTVKITAKSYENRYTRELEIVILPNDGSVDFYIINSSNIAGEKAKFGYTSSSKPGNASGDAQLGSYLWHFVRSNPGNINSDSSGSGAMAFGTGSGPEGTMTFSTSFTKKIKNVIIQTASAAGKDPETGYTLGYGSATLKAWFGTAESPEYLERTIDGKKYGSTEVSHTTKHSNDEPYSYHTIHCLGKTGSFTFEFGPSVGATYLKSILIEYDE